jgi:hypothetical protein
MKKITYKILWICPGGNRGLGRPISRWIDGVEEDRRKLGCRIGGRLPRMELAGDIRLRRPRIIQGWRAGDGDDNDDDDDDETKRIS